MNDLDTLGAERKRLLAELDDLTPKLHAAMREARAAGATQNDIRERSGYKTIQQVRVILGEVKARADSVQLTAWEEQTGRRRPDPDQ